MRISLIAPCGMNCSLCYAFLREKNRCPGCRAVPAKNWESHWICKVRSCSRLKEKNWKFCSARCKEFPCPFLKHLDKRYRTKYGMSMIKNLDSIKAKGIRKFIEQEKSRWIKGGKIFCVHKKQYFPLESKIKTGK